MTVHDLDAVLAIEESVFPDPFSRELFESELKQQAATVLVARMDSRLAGYIDYWTILDEIHLINIAVHPDHRRLGIATQLFNYMMDKHSPRLVYLEVRSSNQVARLFYEKLGFHVIGSRKRYYRDGEDALVYVLSF